MELNYNAKVLVKLMNSMNKSKNEFEVGLRESRRNQEQDEQIQSKPEQFPVDKQSYKIRNAT